MVTDAGRHPADRVLAVPAGRAAMSPSATGTMPSGAIALRTRQARTGIPATLAAIRAIVEAEH